MPILVMKALFTVIVSPLSREHLKVRLKHPARARPVVNSSACDVSGLQGCEDFEMGDRIRMIPG